MPERRYLIERRKARAQEFYILRLLDATSALAAIHGVGRDFCEGDTARVSAVLEGVEVELTSTGSWQLTGLAGK